MFLQKDFSPYRGTDYVQALRACRIRRFCKVYNFFRAFYVRKKRSFERIFQLLFVDEVSFVFLVIFQTLKKSFYIENREFICFFLFLEKIGKNSRDWEYFWAIWLLWEVHFWLVDETNRKTKKLGKKVRLDKKVEIKIYY